MKYVHIIAMDPKTGGVDTRATCVHTEGSSSVECQGDDGLVEQLKLGVFHPGLKRTLTPDDGDDFLAALRYEYSHPSLMASDVIEGDSVEPYAPPPARTPEQDAA